MLEVSSTGSVHLRPASRDTPFIGPEHESLVGVKSNAALLWSALLQPFENTDFEATFAVGYTYRVPQLDLSRTFIAQIVAQWGWLTFVGSIDDIVSPSNLGLWVFVGGSPSPTAVATNLASDTEFTFSVYVSNLGLPNGDANVTVRARNADGFWSQGWTFSFTVRESQGTPGPRPPPQNSASLTGYLASDSSCIFHFELFSNGQSSTVTLGGFTPVLRTGDQTFSAPYSGDFTAEGLTLRTSVTQLSPTELLVTLTITNVMSEPIAGQVAFHADIDLPSNSVHTVQDLGGGTGFRMYTARSGDEIQFIGRNSPLVSDVATYWFGPYSTRSYNLWTQVTDEYVYLDAGFAFSWAWTVPARDSVSMSAMFRLPVEPVPVLAVEVTGLNTGTRTMTIAGSVSSDFSRKHRIVAGGAPGTTFQTVAVDIYPERPFTGTVNLSEIRCSGGICQLFDWCPRTRRSLSITSGRPIRISRLSSAVGIRGTCARPPSVRSSGSR
jgi:hypothetical protein